MSFERISLSAFRGNASVNSSVYYCVTDVTSTSPILNNSRNK